MKQIYFFTAIFILAITFKSHSQIVANFSNVNSGTLSGVPFTFTNNTTSFFSTDLSGSGFSAAPISGTTQIVQAPTDDNWTVTFDTPISNLRLYCRYFRTNALEFDQSFTILSSDGTFLNPSGNQLETTTFSNGIIEFNSPISTLNLTYISGDSGNIAFTFGLATTLSIEENEIESKKLTIYPNPSNDFINVNGLTEIENFSIYNALGQEIKKGTVFFNEKIDIKNLTNGLYFLKFEKGNTLNFIKK